MSAAMTVFRLTGDTNGMFDGSVNGITLTKSVNAKVLAGDAGIAINNGWVDVAPHRDLNPLPTFTIEATVTPTSVGNARQNIIEAQGARRAARQSAPQGIANSKLSRNVGLI